MKTEQSTKENGSLMKTLRMEEVFRFGPMAQGMTASGKMEWPMATEDLFMPKEMSTRESGLMTKLMDMEYTLILTDPGTKVNGSKISNTATVSSSGLMVPSTRAHMNKE